MIHIIGITAMSRLFTDTDLTDMLQAIERLIKVLWDLNFIYFRVCVHNGLGDLKMSPKWVHPCLDYPLMDYSRLDYL